MRNHPAAPLGFVLLALASTSCGGGGSDAGTDETLPFGLEGTFEVQGLGFDFGSTQPGNFETTNPWPGVSLASVDLAVLPDGSGRLISVDKSGFITSFLDSPTTQDGSVWLNLQPLVSQSGGEAGLLGIAFRSDYAINPWVYLFSSRDAPLRSVVSRIPVIGDVPQLGSEQILLSVPQQNNFHNGGQIAFGNDGFLYVSVGDDGEAATAQDLGSLKGKILRLQADGSPAPGNPFAGTPGARPEIFAYGFRNVWRFSIDGATGDLWAADVGEESREEIDIVQAGGNYGWPYFEGTEEFDNPGGVLFSDTQAPFFEYDHNEGQSIIGGYVYRGNELPSLQGAYLYTDSVVGSLWAVRAGPSGPENTLIVTGLPFPVSLAPDLQGEPRIGCLSGGQTLGLSEMSGGDGPAPVPPTLSATGIFTDLASLTPQAGFVPYAPNAPFWSDGSEKRRWIGLPPGGAIGFSPTEAWSFPIGTILVKHFELDTLAGVRRLETRVQYRTQSGWEYVTYRWNDSGTEAALVVTPELAFFEVDNPLSPGTSVSQPWLFMTAGQCRTCHTPSAGQVLGATTAQINGQFDYPLIPDNQLRAWNHVGLFSSSIGSPIQYTALPNPYDETSGTVTARARAYLDTNCANCHRPNGPTGLNMDMRASTPVSLMNTHGIQPLAGQLGLGDPQRIAPFSTENSVVHERMQRLDLNRMPPVGSYTLDLVGLDLLQAWIDSGAP